MIAVPSKGRLNSPTIRQMEGEGLEVYVFVDPPEWEDYQYAYQGAQTTIVPAPGGDIALVRQAILDMARVAGETWCWQVDDDVRRIKVRRTPDRKYEDCSWGEALSMMEVEMERWPTVALGGPSPIQYAWAQPQNVLNGHHNGITLLRTDAPVDYALGVIEDMDIVLQAWAAGWHTLRMPTYAYDCPQMGTGPGGKSVGGMREAYDAGWQEPRREATLVKWRDSGLVVEGGKYGFHLSRKHLTTPERRPL